MKRPSKRSRPVEKQERDDEMFRSKVRRSGSTSNTYVYVGLGTVLLLLCICIVRRGSLYYSVGKIGSQRRIYSPMKPTELSVDGNFSWTVNGVVWEKNGSKTSPLQDALKSTCIVSNNTLNIKGNITICVKGSLPIFQHKPPLFVHEQDAHIFELQPENQLSLQMDWVDWSFETCFVLRPNTSIKTAKIVGLESNSFQHFHDNALPFIYQASQGLNALIDTDCTFEERVLYEHPNRNSKILKEEWAALGFPKSSLYEVAHYQKLRGGIAVVRSKYPRDKIQVRVHPLHVQWLRSAIPQYVAKTSKVVWISRVGAQDGGIFARQCTNEHDFVIPYLKQHISNLVVFNPTTTTYSMEELVTLLGDACAIVGIHGGGMYNQFFAHSDTSVVELFPIRNDGLIHGQWRIDSNPKQAHRAIWHNSNLLGQLFWRIHFETLNAKEFAISKPTLETTLQALQQAKCT